MTTTRNRWLVTAALSALILVAILVPRGARAADPCIGDAKLGFGECRAQCKEDYQVAKDDCLNRDHACVEGCRAGRSGCIDALSLDEDLAACRETLRTAKQKCRDDNPEGSPELDACIDREQVAAFQCRDGARERARPGVKACRAGFRACTNACPPGNGEVTDPEQCRRDAKSAYGTCRATCNEDFQFQRDACHNRDHVCVEGCRATRDSCRQPVEDQLSADIAACNATRKTTVEQDCAAKPEGPERDQCIDDAQVAAFVCRDQAHEDARPGFAACRQLFRTCAQGCPPAQ